ncbi:peptidylprolyl isomerase [Elysia marginata]|uniref:peptidylprolyl isomerase n=1 Tax=Elysia marginata TaxID=1093978 RepID=A0AAV4GR64_9GAST|nr:peptidylprolyl isomerase [Elysia marginata]
MIVKLHYKKTPVTVANFISLAEGTNPYLADSLQGKPYYDGVIFHRVIKDFIIQGGDRTGTGLGNPGYRFKDEISDSLRHDKKGILSMANAGANTNGSQFFITHKPTPFLDGRHTVFGEIVRGFNIVDTIASVDTSKEPKTRDKPLQDVVIEKVSILRYGKQAKEFDAPSVFSQDYKKQEKREKEKKEKAKVASQNILEEFKNQESLAKSYLSGIKILPLEKGKGATPKKGATVLLNYAGYLKESGMLFDTSWLDVAERFAMVDEQRKAQRGYSNFKVRFDESSQLIAGFKEAMLTLEVGDKIRVFIPSKLGYGESGAGGGIIPPNANLVFDIELQQIVK